ncbi:hypothetical protein V2I88_24740, partial [Pseudomonas viridiflava]|nr:hypothetical protein [Pseudomonas viridiflava]
MKGSHVPDEWGAAWVGLRVAMLWHYTELKQVWLAEHIPVDVELSRSRHRTVGGGLPAMQSTRYVRKIASSFIAG